MPSVSAPFRIWSYCSMATLRPKLVEAGCEFVQEPAAETGEVREVTETGLKVMVLPGCAVRVALRAGESEDAARTRVYAIVKACEAEQDAREEAEAERKADARLSKVLNHAIKVLWVLQRPNKPDDEMVTLELRRPSPREKRRFADATGAVRTYEAADIAESRDAHVKYRVTAHLR
jgi:hypothetical protein